MSKIFYFCITVAYIYSYRKNCILSEYNYIIVLRCVAQKLFAVKNCILPGLSIANSQKCIWSFNFVYPYLPSAKHAGGITSGPSAKATFCRMDSSTGSLSGQESTVNLSFFNEDLLCPHRGLSTTPNKRLVSSAVWRQIFEAYFYPQHQSGFEFGGSQDAASKDR